MTENSPSSLRRNIGIAANATWNLWNFRRGLIRALIEEGHRVTLLTPAGPHIKDLEDAGADVVVLEHLRRSGMNPVRELLVLSEIHGALRQYKVDVLLTFTVKPVIYGGFAARWAGVGHVATLTGLGYVFISGGWASRLVSFLYRRALTTARTVFFHNPDDRQAFVSAGLVKPAVAKVVPGSGIELAKYPRENYDQAVPGRCLFVGRLLADKGVREYVGAATELRAENPGWAFHIVGGLDDDNPAGCQQGRIGCLVG